MSDAPANRPPLTPRFWLSWAGVGLMWLLGKLPQRVGLALSVPLGALLRRLLGRRRRIAERNLERCFPEHSAEQRATLLAAHFRALARMLFEICWSWSASGRRIERWGRWSGIEHIEKLRSEGRGVLMMTVHMTCLEIGGRIAAIKTPEVRGVYRPLENPVLEWYQNRGRERYVEASISKRDLRPAIRHMKKGGMVWYASDQDFGAERSVFVPFFGIETATLEATLKLIRVSRCAVVPMFPRFDPLSNTYTVSFDAPLDNFPSDDASEDLARLNRLFEEKIRQAPEQYWWIHRRFKTRPPGEPPFYD